VSIFEYDHRWYGGIPTPDEYQQALTELKEE
jgi:hypothetical protein